MSTPPDMLLMVECPECGKSTTSDEENFQLQVGELNCPWCGANKSPENTVARFKRVGDVE